MNALAIDCPTTSTNQAPGDVRPQDKRVWVVPCTDAFGRSYELAVTAYRGQGIGFTTPAGEFGLVDIDVSPALVEAITEAGKFMRGTTRGVRRCTPKR